MKNEHWAVFRTLQIFRISFLRRKAGTKSVHHRLSFRSLFRTSKTPKASVSTTIFTKTDELHFSIMHICSVRTSYIGWSMPSFRACDFPVDILVTFKLEEREIDSVFDFWLGLFDLWLGETVRANRLGCFTTSYRHKVSGTRLAYKLTV